MGANCYFRVMRSAENNGLHTIVDIAVESLPPAVRAAQRPVVEIGSDHIVVLLGQGAAVGRFRRAGTLSAGCAVGARLTEAK